MNMKFDIQDERIAFEDTKVHDAFAQKIITICLKHAVPRDIEGTQANKDKVEAEVNEYAASIGLPARCRTEAKGAGVYLKWSKLE